MLLVVRSQQTGLSRKRIYQEATLQGISVPVPSCPSHSPQKIPQATCLLLALGEFFCAPSTFHPSSHLCAASPLFNCSLLMAGLCLTHRRCPPAPPLPWEAQAASRQIFSMLTLPWPLHGEVPKFSLSFYFLPSLAKILISGSRHLLHFSDQSSCPSRMFSIPGSLRGSRVTHRKKNEVITISSLIQQEERIEPFVQLL